MSTHLWTIFMISIQVLCHVVDLKHGFVTSWENVLFSLENIGTCVKITWNYFLCLALHKVKVFIDYAQGLVQLLLLIFSPPPVKPEGTIGLHSVCLSVRHTSFFLKWFPDDNWLCNQPMIMKLHTLTHHESRMRPIDFEVKRSKVKVMAHGYLKMVSGR